MTVIAFAGCYTVLSNFSPHPAWYDGTRYSTAEHAFQAAKFLDEAARQHVRDAPTPREARTRGRSSTHPVRSRWDEGGSQAAMAEILASKLAASWQVHRVLLSTGTAELVELNTWHDNRWGRCTCGDRDRRHPACREPGSNWLGAAWMDLRARLLSDASSSWTGAWHR